MRARANELRAEVKKLSFTVVPDADGSLDMTRIVAAIVGLSEAASLEAVADGVEYSGRTSGSDSFRANRQAITERNHAIRLAAINGNIDEIVRLATETNQRGNDSGRDADASGT